MTWRTNASTEIPLLYSSRKDRTNHEVSFFSVYGQVEYALIEKGFLVEKHLYGTTTARILHYPV